MKMKKRWRPSWDEYFMLLAKIAAIRSTCLSRMLGAVIVKDKRVLVTGYNGAVTTESCLERGVCFRREQKADEKTKYEFCVANHAEANAIAMASEYGIRIGGATIYSVVSPCIHCAKLIIRAGIKRVVYETSYLLEDKVKDAADDLPSQFLKDKGIEVEQLEMPPLDFNLIKDLLSKDSGRRRIKEGG